MLPVYVAQNLTEAELLAQRLRTQGMRTYIRNEALQGALGELPLTLKPEVCILDERDLELALATAREYEQAQRNPVLAADQLCPHCGELSPGNFEVCWKCREPFPEH
jgi:hypothetical protein